MDRFGSDVFSGVSKAKNGVISAFNTAAAKAERALTEFKEDLKADFGRSTSLGNAYNTAAARAERAMTEFKEDFKVDIGRSISLGNGSAEPSREIPRSGRTNTKKLHEEKLCNWTPNFSKEEVVEEMATEAQSTSAALEDDETLRGLRFRYIPKRMKEHEVWKRYFMADDRVKQEVSSNDTKTNTVLLTDSCDLDQDPAACNLQSESPKKDPIEEDAYKKAMSVVVVPSSKLLRKLAAAIEVSRCIDKVKDLEIVGKNDKDFPQGGGLVSGLTAMKNSFLRESKESKCCTSGEIEAYLCLLFEADMEQNDVDTAPDSWCQAMKSKVPEEIRGAPPRSFVAHLAEVMGCIGTVRRMAEFWPAVISELRRRWDEGEPIPRLPMDSNPDLRYCLLHQKLQVINCCIARQKCHAANLESLDALSGGLVCMDSENISGSNRFSSLCCSQDVLQRLFVKEKEGQMLLRLGADCPAANLRMLETGEQVYSPITQDGPILTEDLIKETEELVLRTGSVGAGCSQLLSDMQAFKAANPGCILEDFVRWYSPLDWRQDPVSGPSVNEWDKETASRGYLSARMQSQGNLWQELWASAKPIPAAKQAPLFDEDLAAESTLDSLEDIRPADLFEQLFTAILGAGFAIAESSPLAKKDLIAFQFRECKDFIISTCSKGMDAKELEELCQVYETMEVLFQYPSEDLQDSRTSPPRYSDGAGTVSVLTEKGSKYYNNLITNDRSLLRRLGREQQSLHPRQESGFSIFTRILEAKSTFFDKKPSQASEPIEDEKQSNLQENEWTLV